MDAVLPTKWAGLYRGDRLYHVGTPAFCQFGGKWYCYTQACPLPGKGNGSESPSQRLGDTAAS